MNEFFKAFVKTALAVTGTAGALLLALGAALLLEPHPVGTALLWALGLGCPAGGIGLIVCLIRFFLTHR